MKKSSQGFTVIETVLFLGVTGLMVASMFIAVGSSIGTQRYKDSVETFKSTLQQQYASVSSVQNTREGTWTCGLNGGNLNVQRDTTAGVTYRGQTQCSILGTFVKVEGSKIDTYTILSYKSGTPTGADDILKLASSGYVLGVSDTDVQKKEIEWGARLVWPKKSSVYETRTEAAATPANRSIALLVLRSPDSGAVYTFTSDTVPAGAPSNAQIKAMLKSGATVPGRNHRLLCIDPDGLVATETRAIIINKYTSDSSGVRVAIPSDFATGNPC